MHRYLLVIMTVAIALSMIMLLMYSQQLFKPQGMPLTNRTWMVPQLRHAVVIAVSNSPCNECTIRILLRNFTISGTHYELFIDNEKDITPLSFVARIGNSLLVVATMNFSTPIHYLVLYYGSANVGKSIANYLPVRIRTNATQSITEVTIPISVPNLCTDPACLGLGFLENGKPVPFYVIKIDPNTVVAMIKANVVQGTATIDVVYNNTNAHTVDKNLVQFFDGFEGGLVGWVMRGNTTMVSNFAFEGKHSLFRYSSIDPSGVYASLPFEISKGTCVAIYTWIYRSEPGAGTCDRVGFINNTGYGYGYMENLIYNELGVDYRKNYIATAYFITSSKLGSLLGVWHLAKFGMCIGNDGVYTISVVSDANNTEIYGMYSKRFNTSVQGLQYVYVFGGSPYYVDALTVVKYPSIESMLASVQATASIIGSPPQEFYVAGTYTYSVATSTTSTLNILSSNPYIVVAGLAIIAIAVLAMHHKRASIIERY